jgi:hypothetical protein
VLPFSADLKASLRIAAAILALIALLSSPALSTTMVMMSDENLAITSDAIVAGTVTAVHAMRAADGGVESYVTVRPDEVLKGYVPLGDVTIRERGGRVGDVEQWLFGNPTYTVGESVIAFLRVDAEGMLRTTQMALGKFSVIHDAATQEDVAVRPIDDADVIVPGSALRSRPADDRRSAKAFRSRLRAIVRSQPVPAMRQPLATAPIFSADERLTTSSAGFKLFNNVRWFEPDQGLPVMYKVDAAGDPKIGVNASRKAVDDVLHLVRLQDRLETGAEFLPDAANLLRQRREHRAVRAPIADERLPDLRHGFGQQRLDLLDLIVRQPEPDAQLRERLVGEHRGVERLRWRGLRRPGRSGRRRSGRGRLRDHRRQSRGEDDQRGGTCACQVRKTVRHRSPPGLDDGRDAAIAGTRRCLGRPKSSGVDRLWQDPSPRP